ncbi:MAG: LpqB family beta-propeller domain-containing protein [Jatrophihabitantaceae bacterium]
MTRPRVLALLSAAAVLLTACTGVPASSAPQVVKQVGVAKPSSDPAITPTVGADPRTVVLEFLSANALVNESHANARDFLTPLAKNKWLDTTVTVLDSLQVGNFTNGSVTVRGREKGTVNSAGIYTPVLQGDGGGGVSVSFAFVMKKVLGEWRVDTLTSGLILSDADFQRIYQQRSIYFYDLTEQHLVRDPRYSSLTDPSLLANWLTGQLANGPRPELQNAVSRELPAQTDPRRVAVLLGSPITVELPGAAKLDAGTRDRLAGQLALTLDQVVPGAFLSILDGGRPVSVPSAGGTQFTASGFRAAANPANTAPALFYIHGEGVVDATGKPLPGDLGSGQYHLASVALAGVRGSQDLLAAGTSGPPSNARLLVGTARTGLRSTVLHGRLSRPSWAPNLNEVWVGDGAQVYRITRGGKPSVVPVAGPGALTGRVSALRFSPEGSRVAVVLSAPDGTGAQVWVGSVVRTSAQVRVDSLEPISPQGIAVTDVAWNDQLKLFTIGRVLSTGEPSVYEVQVDGSLWTPRSSQNLPGAPDSITVAENVPAWVSVGPTVWAQSGGSWAGPRGEQTPGTNPTYLE